jgi:hypothetical protein
VAAAQPPCTSDAGRVVSELYRHIMERGSDAGAGHWQQQLANGRMTVRDVVRNLVTSQEHHQRFGQTEAYERAVARLYRHILGRQPDPDGQRHWAQTAQRQGLNSVAESMVNSQEYTNNFGEWGVPGSGGMTFCAPSDSISLNQPRSPITEPRFRGMDTNRDGAISRNEWRGSAQSFRVHDWDGNGVLEGDEVRAGAFRRGRTLEDEDLDRGERFEFLDTTTSAPAGGLIARIENGAAVYVGDRRAMRAPRGGRL